MSTSARSPSELLNNTGNNNQQSTQNTIKNIHRRPCVCKRPECCLMSTFWRTCDSDKTTPRNLSRTAFIQLPVYHFEPENLLKRYRNKVRQVYCRHLFARNQSTAPDGMSGAEFATSRLGAKSTRYFIAAHHFPQEYLRDDGKGLTCCTTDVEGAEILKLTNSDILDIEDHEEYGKYIVPPCCDWNSLVREFVNLGGQLTPPKRGPKSKQFVNEDVINGQLLDFENDGEYSKRSFGSKQTNPSTRATTMLTNRIKKQPEAFAVEFEKLEKALLNARQNLLRLEKDDLKMSASLEATIQELELSKEREIMLQLQCENGLSRSNLISDTWHSSHKDAAPHLFGSVYDSWDYFKDMMTVVFFPEIEVSGGSGPITEFEKVMMTLIRINRAYEYETIGLIFGEDRRRIGDYVRQYDFRFGEIGLMLSILDMDAGHDYISKDDAARLGVAHSEL